MDTVNHPRHYRQTPDPLANRVRNDILDDDVDPMNIECFEAMVSMLTVDEIRGYLRGNSFKYRWRYRHKAGVQDLQKANWYEQKLIKLEAAIQQYFNGEEDL